MIFGCIGEHLTHSFSAEIHHVLSKQPYDIWEVPRAQLDSFMRARDFCGINVTIPYKEAILPYLFWMSEQAKEIGAVNTVINRKGKLYGYNTDFFGMQDMLRYAGIPLRDKKVAVLGTGGTARTALAVANALGAECTILVSRNPSERAVSYETLLNEYSDTEILINTTPCGMYPHADGNEQIRAVAVNVADFPSLCGVVDAVYNPLRTNLILDAQKRGVPAVSGLYMLVAQAVRASELFLERSYPQEIIESVYRSILRQKENVVLTGMPSCGKSSVGKRLARALKRPFYDLDSEIEKRMECKIADLICSKGEDAFRNIETMVLREVLSQKNGIVLATGGGTVLRDENVDLLRRNGRIFFIDRPLDLLIPTADRPLSSNASMMKKRYEERYSRYCAVADACVDGNGSVKEVEMRMQREWTKDENLYFKRS